MRKTDLEQEELWTPSIAVIGIGGVGGYLAGMLSAGCPHVSVVARGKRFETISQEGIRLHSDLNGEITGRPERVVRAIPELGVQDVVFVCVKNYSLQDVIADLPSIVGEQTLVIPVMNGIDPGARIRSGLSRGRVADAVIYIVSYLLPDGSVCQEGKFADIRVGFPDSETDPDAAGCLRQLARLLTRAGLCFKISKNVTLDIWRKFVLNSGYNVGTAYHDAPIGVLRDNPEWVQEYIDLTTETWMVGRAAGVPLTQEDLDMFIHRFRTEYRDDASSSLQRDMHAGRPSEVETFCGYTVRLGDALGVDIPVTRRVYTELLEREKKVHADR